MKNQLTLKTEIQKVLFFNELQGQLSDGMWENTEPLDHWKVWCGLTPDQVKVAGEGDEIGHNFPTIYNTYQFTRLLPIIGERMLMIARVATLHPEKVNPGNYHLSIGSQDLVDVWGRVQFNQWEFYGPEDLRKDLQEISKAFKTLVGYTHEVHITPEN